MTTFSHERPTAAPRPWWTVRDLWASLAITAMWVAVAVTAFAGTDIRTTDSAGDGAVVPAAVGVALFATICSWLVARHAFRPHDDA